MIGTDIDEMTEVTADADDANVGKVTKPFVKGIDAEMLLGRCFRPFNPGFFFLNFGPDDVVVVVTVTAGDVNPTAASTSLLFLDCIDADGGP